MINRESVEIIPNIKIAFLDVGQADTIVISCPDTQEAIIVDCVNAKVVRDYLTREHITQLRGIIITHLHADHYREVPLFLKNYRQIPGMQECKVLAFNEVFNQKNLQKLIQDDDEHSDPSKGSSPLIPTSLQNLIDWRDQNESKYALLQVQQGLSKPYQSEGTLIKSLHLLHPHAAQFRRLEAKGLNNTSVVLQIKGPGAKALLTGDLEPKGWKWLSANHPDLRSDVLKFPHHGGAWNGNDIDDLLDKVNPSIVVISVGSEGFERYVHPHPDVFEALAKRPHIRVLCTQATNQCHQKAQVQNERNAVIQKFKVEVDRTGHQIFFSKKGCPCAGTVIIELGEKARLLEPEISFHRETVIKAHYKVHQCNFEDAMSERRSSILQVKERTN